MAKKVEVYVHPEYAAPLSVGAALSYNVPSDEADIKYAVSLGYVPASIVIHDGPHEPVYTATEVRAMLGDLKSEAEDKHVREWIDGVAERHGFSPDVMGMAVPKSEHAE